MNYEPQEFILVAIGTGMFLGFLLDGIGQLWQAVFNTVRHRV